MPRCRKKCAKRYQEFTSAPRPCVDSVHLPFNFYIPQHMFYPPPCYHTPIVTPEFICECPDSSGSSTSINCMPHHRAKKCSGGCTSDDSVNEKYNQVSPKERRVEQNQTVPYTPSENQSPPQYQSGLSDIPKYEQDQRIDFEEKEYISYPRTYQKIIRTQERYRQSEAYKESKGNENMGSDKGTHNTQHTTKNNDSDQCTSVNQESGYDGPPPRYADAVEVTPPHYSFPGSCCKSNARGTEVRTISRQNLRGQESSPETSRTRSPRYSSIRSDNSEPSPCCAHAYSKKKDDKPPLPKGMSGAHRPGYVFNDPEDKLDISNSRCMSGGSACSHGITSIMPNVPHHVTPERKASTCSCKDITGKIVKSTRKKNCLKEAGTDTCESVTCLANKNRFCPCIYPPAFKHLSCAGNITGCCNCNEHRF